MKDYFLTRRMILRSPESERLVHRIVEELKMQPLQDENLPPEQGITRVASWQMSPSVIFQYLEDSRSTSAVVVLIADSAAHVEKYATLIERLLQPLTYDELLAAVAEADSDERKAQAVLRAGLGAPVEFDQRFFDVLVESMVSDRVVVRVAAVWATTYSLWPQFREPLALVAETEPDPSLREEASFVLEASLANPVELGAEG